MRENRENSTGKSRSGSPPDAASSLGARELPQGFSRSAWLLVALVSMTRPVLATSVIPLSDAELYRRADVVVHGIVVSSDVSVDDQGRPETLTFIEPLAVLKGQVSGSLVLHQAGGTLPDGRFFKLWGRPEYIPGREVVVFALARAKGEYETAEMMLGKFEVWRDTAGERFAVPDLAISSHPGVNVHPAPRKLRADAQAEAGPATDELDGDAAGSERLPRRLAAFLSMLRTGDFQASVLGSPSGDLEPVFHEQDDSGRATPQWGMLSNALYRWNNNATAAFTLNGTTNITGGGTAEAANSVATWTNDPNTTINYSIGNGAGNTIYLNAVTSTLGCGWSTCMSGGGVIGCGGPTGLNGGNTWRGETYSTISQGTVELRSYCTANLFSSTLTQSVITHELGHTLGLGHSDQTVSPHDVCRGDESYAIMRSMVQSYNYLTTDDQDAVRWLYGDGGNSCGAGGVPPAVTTTAASGVLPTASTLNGTINPSGLSTSGYFQYGTSTGYGSSTSSQSVGSGTVSTAVSASVSGLACGTLYHFRAVGTNAGGTGTGADMTFTTAACPPPPSATTSVASGVAETSATFTGSANPNGTSTSVYFQYGTTNGYGNATAPQAVGSGTSSVAVSQAAFGLACNRLYHFRIVAASASGTSVGTDQTMTTGACVPEGFYTVTPCRVADTRNPAGPYGGPALAAGADRTFTIAGQCGVPTTARSVAINLTVTQSNAGGDLRLYSAGGATPPSSSINYKTGQTRANNTRILLGAGGALAVHSDQASGSVQVIIDVNGYFQ